MKIIRNLLVFTLFLTSIAWLAATNMGLRVIIGSSCVFLPVKVNYKRIYGSLMGDCIVVDGVQITKDDRTVNIGQIQFDWRSKKLLALAVKDWAMLIPPQSALNLDLQSELQQITAQVAMYKSKECINIIANGKWYHEPLTANIALTHQTQGWQINSLDAKIGQNKLQLWRDMEGIYSLNADLKRSELLLDDFAGEIYAAGRLDTKNDFNFELHTKQLLINDIAINDFTIKAKGQSKDTQIKSEHVTLSMDKYQVYGNAAYDPLTQVIKVEFNDNWYSVNAGMNVDDFTLTGNVHANTDDLSLIMQLIPEVTRLKGKADLHLTLGGTITDPNIEGQAHLTNITATVPSLGVKIKPMELHVTGDKTGKLIISGKGLMRRGSGEFSIDGYIEPFKDNMPNEINIVGKHVEFVNNSTAHLIASNNLKFIYDHQAMYLNIKGNIAIESGNINFSKNNASTIKSKDVVFVNEPQKTSNYIRLNPEIFLRIEDGVKFNGLGLDAVVSGKLDINQRQDAVYANGRVTIKEGTYHLPGQTLTIKKGRLLFPPGTLLTNPVLDIKMQSNDNDGDLHVIVQGTAQKPVIAESNLAKNQDKALSQLLLTSSGLLSNNLLQDKLELSEFGITSNDEINVDFFDNPATKSSDLKNKNLVIGRPLGKRLHLQYLRNMEEARNRLRLKYALGKYWSVGIEGGNDTLGNGAALGADLSFVIETD